MADDELGPNDKLIQVLDRQVSDTVRTWAKWYRTNRRWPRIIFRAAGIYVLVVSSAIPILAGFYEGSPGRWAVDKDLLIAILSGSVALVTAIGTFFRWEMIWQSRLFAGEELEFLETEWNARVAELGSLPRREADAALSKIYHELMSRANVIRGQEAENFFKLVQWPRGKAE